MYRKRKRGLTGKREIGKEDDGNLDQSDNVDRNMHCKVHRNGCSGRVQSHVMVMSPEKPTTMILRGVRGTRKRGPRPGM